MRFVKDLKFALRRRNKTEMLTLSEEIGEAEENGYELSDEEEILLERMFAILETMEQ